MVERKNSLSDLSKREKTISTNAELAPSASTLTELIFEYFQPDFFKPSKSMTGVFLSSMCVSFPFVIFT